MKKDVLAEQKKKWMFAILTTLVLGIIAIFAASIMMGFAEGESPFAPPNSAALIPIKGMILTEKTAGFLAEGIVSSSDTVKFIEDADKNPNIKAIVLEIDSSGGGVVASKEIVDAVKSVNKTTVAWIRESGASGAYWIASACDVVVADPLSMTGSIGVYSSYLEFDGLMRKYGVGYERLVAGEYKDIGTPFRNMTSAEKEMMQAKLDKIHQYLIIDVAKNRNMSEKKVAELATGMIYLGMEAKENGLVDELGGKGKVVEVAMDKTGLKEVVFVKYEQKKSFMESLVSAFSSQSFYVGRGIGDSLFEKTSVASSDVSIKA